MATRYWVGGTGNWDSFDTSHWSATSGGAPGASVPQEGVDDVVFDASSGSAFTVNCSFSYCRNLTASPATGMTFNATGGILFSPRDGDINIAANCTFTSATGSAQIQHSSSGSIPARTYSVSFNGAATRNVSYLFTSYQTNDQLNFCSGLTQTLVNVIVTFWASGCSFTCTSANITCLGYDSTAADFIIGGYSPLSAITLTSSVINIGSATGSTANLSGGGNIDLGNYAGVTTLSTTSSTLRIYGYATGSFPSPTIWIGKAGVAGRAGFSGALIIGATAGSVSVYATSLNTINTSNYGSAVRLYDTTSVTGAVTTRGALIVDYTSSSLCTFGSTVSTSSSGGYAGSVQVTNAIFNGAVTLSGGTVALVDSSQNIFGIGGTVTLNSALSITGTGGGIDGSFGTLTAQGITMTPGTGARMTATFGALTATSLTTTNTDINVSGNMVVNGASGTFSFTQDATAPGVCNLRFGSATVSTPTCSIVGTSTKRVEVNTPLSVSNPTAHPFTRTGSAPTLTNVSFFGTVINGGATTYTGTRLGTDGQSSGFVPEPAANKYMVLGAGGTLAYDTAIWALTSGGAGAVDNLPLPQDTVIVDANTGGDGSAVYTDRLRYLNSFVRLVGALNIELSGPIALLGDYVTQTTTSQDLSNVTFVTGPSTNRFMTLVGSSTRVATLNTAFTDSTVFTIGGTSTPILNSYFATTQFYINLAGGTTRFENNIALGVAGTNVVQFSSTNTTITGGNWSASTNFWTYGTNTTVNSSNYVINLAASFGTNTYANNAPATAINGAVSVRGVNNAIAAGSTTATNPLRYLEFRSVATTGTQTLTLNGTGTTVVYVQDLSSVNSVGTVATVLRSQSLVSGSAVTITKTNGGRSFLQKYTGTLTVNNVKASPADTFYTTGTLSNNTTGWVAGTPPAVTYSGFLLY